ncbi:MAG: AMP-dependent synthetase/ligase [Candidatus Dormiibacterota bacterium]
MAAPTVVEPSLATELSIVGLFFRQVERRGERPFLVHYEDGRWQTLTWTQCREQVLRVASRLVDAGVAAGDAVVLMAPNSVEWVVADLAIQSVGGVTAPIYPTSGRSAAAAVLQNCEAGLAFVDTEERATRLGAPRTVLLDREFQEWASEPAGEAALAEVARRLHDLAPDQLATIVYTSGTTGEPKGVELAHRTLAEILQSCLSAFHMGPADRALSLLPMSHVLERVNGLYILIATGASAWLTRGPAHLLDDIAVCQPTVMVCVPRVYEKVYQGVLAEVRHRPALQRRLFWWALGQGKRHAVGEPAPGFVLADRLVLRSLRRRLTGGHLRYFVSGGAPLLQDVEAFFWAIGVKILQGWGLTETSAGATGNREEAHRYETVGQALPGVELRVAEDGEILVKSPGNLIGYHREGAATAAVLTEEGWFRSGDIGTIDADGYLRITDRKKDLMKTAGGKFVAPQMLEARLLQDAAVSFAIVIGDLRPYVTALIVPAWDVVRKELHLRGEPNQLLDEVALRAHLQAAVDRANEGLGNWETIKRFTIMAEDFSESNGELTPTLKVRRQAVLEHRAEAVETMYATPRERRER